MNKQPEWFESELFQRAELNDTETKPNKMKKKKNKRRIWTNIKHKHSVIQQDLKAYEMKFNYFVSFTIFHVSDSVIETPKQNLWNKILSS